MQCGLPTRGPSTAPCKGPGPSSRALGRSPHQHSWALRAPSLVFNKEDEFSWKPLVRQGVCV